MHRTTLKLHTFDKLVKALVMELTEDNKLLLKHRKEPKGELHSDMLGILGLSFLAKEDETEHGAYHIEYEPTDGVLYPLKVYSWMCSTIQVLPPTAVNVNTYAYCSGTRVYEDYETDTDFVVYAGRGSKYGLGNPFTVNKSRNRDSVIALHATAFECENSAQRRTIEEIVEKANGKRIVYKCFCKPKTCHTDVYVKYTNEILMKNANIKGN